MSKSNMIKLFNQLAYRYSLWDIYSDFIELTALTINSSMQIINRSKNEKRYAEIMKKYKESEQAIFPKLLGELVITMDEKQSDILGELFMEMELGSKNKGQFFTPYNLCLLTSEITFNEEDLKEKGYIELNEPCVGGGAMVLAFSEVMRRHGYNPQKQLKVICQDFDLKAVYMAYVQLSLVGIPAAIYHMNTLSLECYSEWKTPFWILGNWDLKIKKECNQ